MSYVLPFSQLGKNDIDCVGGKNASLGEMISHLSNLGVSVPNGFATTAEAFRLFLQENDLVEEINSTLAALDVDDIHALTAAGKKIRQAMIDAPFPEVLESQIRDYYQNFADEVGDGVSFAVRSSATAEDLPDASFAGQQETFLNVQGIEAILHAIKEVFASLYNDRAIAYRVHQGFAHENVALSAGIQRMVRSDLASSGVMFTLDTESGFRDVIFITASYGLGEMVVQGAVNPDEFHVHKATLEAGRPAVIRRTLGSKAQKMVYASKEAKETVTTEAVDEADSLRYALSDQDIETLAQQAMTIEAHYGCPMDIEWGKDGLDGKLYILQARPETVKSRDNTHTLERWQLNQRGEVLVSGRAIGQRIGSGVVRVVNSLDQMHLVEDGDVLVSDMTDPDWEPVMKRASAIVTNRGGRTCHAAIIARELGVPAVVGCGDATECLQDGQQVTVSCAEGDTGYIYKGVLDYAVERHELDNMPDIGFNIMMNVGNPDRAFDFASLPNAGVGLARLEFIINRMIGIHPRALLEYEQLDTSLKAEIAPLIAAYDSPVDFYVQRLVEGISTIAASFAGKPVIVRMSDFKSNEYANLLGGENYEPHEENPMLGWRGASRYTSDDFRACFELECRALKIVRDDMGLSNVQIMIPFVRTPDEAAQVIEILREQGLERGKNGLKLIMMCELPSNAVLAEAFLEHFDGFSIGSNDMTQLSLGSDRDSGLISHLFDERNPAVKAMMAMAIAACRKHGKYIGICGQGPSDHPDLAHWLREQGISSISLNPDSVVPTWLYLSQQLKS
ncbi:phosphoenolpyruvate synthase [Suttonella sp. R2A3]|uniref:phosphoenolpyruvate synthase n=1 Tax=Suttonella sp. R2A3 TaxID=2908648 RepID=UPI001F32ED4D|nr:phosphoenolpyruvate synthase [Suttonella sp. R2A3]UJF25037.1 phosphoenolpyruvate synthase [Suttonella sp. R2A3]